MGRQNAAPLSHEIEQWSVDGKSYVWVRLPRIPPAGQEASFYMYYGNPTAVAAEVPADVWKDRFVAVYHLATGKDSTGHGFDGTIHGSTAVPAVLGLGQSFVKSSAQYIDLGKNRPIFQSVSGCTLSAWIKPKSFTVDWDTVVGFSVHDAATVPTYSRASLAIKIDKSATIIGDTHDDGSWKELTSPALTVNDWVHVTGVNNFQADAQLIYLDGVERNSKQGVGFGAPATPATAPSGGAIGAQENLASCFFDGLIDEVRLSHEVFSPAWIALDFKSMADTLLTFGEEELKP